MVRDAQGSFLNLLFFYPNKVSKVMISLQVCLNLVFLLTSLDTEAEIPRQIIGCGISASDAGIPLAQPVKNRGCKWSTPLTIILLSAD